MCLAFRSANNGPCSNYVMANCGATPANNSPCSVAVSCDAPARATAAAHCGITVGQNGSYTQYDGMPSTDSRLQILNQFSSQAGGPHQRGNYNAGRL